MRTPQAARQPRVRCLDEHPHALGPRPPPRHSSRSQHRLVPGVVPKESVVRARRTFARPRRGGPPRWRMPQPRRAKPPQLRLTRPVAVAV